MMICRHLLSITMAAGMAVSSSAQSFGMVEFLAAGRWQRGSVLTRVPSQAIVLGRDGWLHELTGSDAGNIRDINQPFAPHSPLELKPLLATEFGRDFEVISTKDFLVVQKVGRGDEWANLFQRSHEGFLSYMSIRGVTLQTGNFPMVAVVMPDESSMLIECRREGYDVNRVLGVYLLDSNRIITHEGGHRNQTGATVRHEAAHQSAYNTGVHSRLNETPRWITEGIGQLFEPPAMTDDRRGANQSDRINRQSLAMLQTTHHDRIQFVNDVRSIIGSDELFDANSRRVGEAYNVAWAVMFYLGERDPNRFAQLLNTTSSRPPFQRYPSADRLADFERITHVPIETFALRVHDFLQSL